MVFKTKIGGDMRFKIKEFFKQENNSARVIFSAIVIAAFLLVFSPAIAQFMRIDGNLGWDNGNGYGYGYGYGFDGGTVAGYRTGGSNLDQYGFGAGYGYMAVAPVDGVYTVDPGDIASLVEAGIMTPNGVPGVATEVTFNSEVELNVAAGVSVTIPSGTTFTAGEGANFADLAAANDVSTSGLSGVTIAGDAMSFGIPDLDLTVDPAITIAVTVGTSYNTRTLKIYRKDADGVWAYTGDTCVVALGICSFETTHLSSFATGTSSAGGGNGSGGDTTAPSNVYVTVNAGAASTTSTSVTLTLGATDNVAVTQMAISNTSDFTNISWETYATSKSWTLTEGNGVKTVYAKFRDTAGNVSVVASDTITLTGQATDQIVITPAPSGEFRTQELAVLSDAEVARRANLMLGTYDYQLIYQSPYPAALAPGATTEVWIEVKNIGTATWFNNGSNVVRLGSGSSYGNAGQQRDYNSEFSNPNWYSANRPTNIMHPEIDPGWHTRFQFIIKAPLTSGVYKAYFTPVVDGITWMRDIGIYWQITVQ